MRGRRPELRTIEGGRGEISHVERTDPPAHVPAAAHVEWHRVIRNLQARKLYDPAMLGAIESYVIATWQLQLCVKAVEKGGAFVKTKAGELKPHPAFAMMGKLHDLVARRGAELGLTPAARARKGMRAASDYAGSDDASQGAPEGCFDP